jgi:5'-nucleotidase
MAFLTSLGTGPRQRFCSRGGDGYVVFARDAENAYDFGPDLADVVVEYLAAHNPYQPATDGRISLE